MLKFCPDCIHYKLPKPRPQISVGFAPGEFEALQKWIGVEEQRRADEQRRVEDGFKFDYEPLFFPWCEKYTPGLAILEEVKKGLMNGDSKPLDEAEENEMYFVIDPANGTVGPAYALCARKNPQGKCVGFKSKASEKIA